jgi:hypothetical protein
VLAADGNNIEGSEFDHFLCRQQAEPGAHAGDSHLDFP